MKGYKVTALVCWTFVALLLVWLLVTGLLGKGLFAPGRPLAGMRDFSRDQGEGSSLINGQISDGETSVSEPVSEIVVDWVSGNVVVHSYAGSEVKWEERAAKTLSDRQKLRYEVKGGRLTIQAYPDWSWNIFGFAGNQPRKDLELWVPASVELDELLVNSASAKIDVEGVAARDVEINTASGDITAQDVKATQMTMGSASGKLELAGCTVEELSLNSVSGSVTAQGAFEEVNVENVSGSVQVHSEAMLKDLNVDTVSGSITIAIPENKGFTLEHTKISGGLNSDFALNFRDDEYSYGNGDADFVVNSVSGSLHLKRIEDGTTGTGRGERND
ncbi:MAG: DUF4097 domain-containing protein [Oscillospiraceae bacterium]|jgi:DUF4097 and DUF4098 domain-containing protein YvlB|nr:DUF4097 domain-containing protein [Oscillospiraceae bacterium]